MLSEVFFSVSSGQLAADFDLKKSHLFAAFLVNKVDKHLTPVKDNLLVDVTLVDEKLYAGVTILLLISKYSLAIDISRVFAIII